MRRAGPLAALSTVLALALAAHAQKDAPASQPVAQPVKPVAQPKADDPNAPPSDAEALKKVGLSEDDAAGLLGYLKSRTLTDADRSKIGQVIERFGADDFEERVKATEDVEKFGSAAIGPLKTAEKGTDPEVAYRARIALRRMEKVPHAAVASAAVRSLVKLKPKDAPAVLLGFLPMADTEEVADDIQAALTVLAVADGKAAPALVQALTDGSALRRTAAYVALIEGGPANQKVRLPDALPLVKAAVQKETDTEAKFRGLWALLLTVRDKDAVADLIALVPQLPRGRLWQVEEFLLLAAGKDKPDTRMGRSAEALGKARDAWAGWWKQKGGAFDLAKFEFKPRVTGFTDIVEYDNTGFGRTRLTILGPDMKARAITGGGAGGANQLRNPSDVKKLPNGNFLFVEPDYGRLTERDTAGRVVKTTQASNPLSVDLLPDGGLVLVCRNQVIQYDKDMKQVWASAQRPNYDIFGGKRMPDGDIVYVTQFNGQPNQQNCFRVSGADGKEVGKPMTLGRVQTLQTLDSVGDSGLLVCEPNRVVEYDLKTGKDVWSYNVNYPTSVQRLPNGNTLITAPNYGNTGRVLEVEPGGEVVWEYESKDGLRPNRASRR
ncbi:MAG: PQQ-binding-like beta-propeller repeat protein [Gemmataceae bacterium]|nr:PQQ-binding-like beta-propeller repeat protein [Gemmataceae bacterium]